MKGSELPLLPLLPLPRPRDPCPGIYLDPPGGKKVYIYINVTTQGELITIKETRPSHLYGGKVISVQEPHPILTIVAYSETSTTHFMILSSHYKKCGPSPHSLTNNKRWLVFTTPIPKKNRKKKKKSLTYNMVSTLHSWKIPHIHTTLIEPYIASSLTQHEKVSVDLQALFKHLSLHGSLCNVVVQKRHSTKSSSLIGFLHQHSWWRLQNVAYRPQDPSSRIGIG